MKGVIPKRPLTSLNGSNPDANGNVSITAASLGALTIDLTGATSGDANPVNADTLAGMTVAQLKASIKTSELNNDAGFITASELKVTSVNGATGAVKVSALYNNSILTTNSGIFQTFGKNGLNTVAGTAFNAPDADWYYHSAQVLQNSQLYFGDLIWAVNSNKLYYHRVAAGGNAGTYQLFSTANFTCSLSGTTLTINYSP